MDPSGIFSESYQKDMTIVRTRLQWVMLVAFLIVLFTFPLYASPSRVHVANLIGVTSISVLGLQILTGYTGQISLGHAAFVAVGAYSSSIIASRLATALGPSWDWLSFWIAFPLAGFVTGVTGMVFGLCSLRIKGLYLALVTVAAHFIIIFAIIHLPRLTGGSLGMSPPLVKLGGFVFNSDQKFFYIVMVLAVLMTFFAKNIVRSEIGRVFIAIRDNDLAAEVMGVHLFRYKMLAFFVSCFFAGVGGSIWAHYLRAIHPDQFSLWQSIWYLGMVIVGGRGSITGTLFGVTFFGILTALVDVLTPEVANWFPTLAAQVFASLGQVFFGLVIALFLIFEPRGLYHRWELLKSYYRLHPFAY